MAKPELDVVLLEATDEFEEGIGLIEVDAFVAKQWLLRLCSLNLSARDLIEQPGVAAFVADRIQIGEVGKLFGCD